MVKDDIKMKHSLIDGEKLFVLIIQIFLFLSVIITLYPFIYVFSMSISEPLNVIKQNIVLLPKGFSLKSYTIIFQDSEVWTSYFNTIWYAVVGTVINVLMTVLTAYPLSRRNFSMRNFFVIFIVITMYFSGGMIPSFLLVKNLHLYNTRWAIVLPAAVSTWNVIIARTYFHTSIPSEIQESATIDGSTEIGILFRVVFPLSLPIMAVVGLYSAVGFWNSYFTALLYLPSEKLQPLQIFLMKVVVKMQSTQHLLSGVQGFDRSMFSEQLKYAIIIVAILPIICVYPFLQKYFIKGVMIGALKG